MLKYTVWILPFIIHIYALPPGWVIPEKYSMSAAAICRNLAVSFLKDSKSALEAYEKCLKDMETELSKVNLAKAEYESPWGKSASYSALRKTLDTIDSTLNRKSGEEWEDHEDEHGSVEEGEDDEYHEKDWIKKKAEQKALSWITNVESSEESLSKSEEWGKDSKDEEGWGDRNKVEHKWENGVGDYEW